MLLLEFSKHDGWKIWLSKIEIWLGHNFGGLRYGQKIETCCQPVFINYVNKEKNILISKNLTKLFTQKMLWKYDNKIK